MRYPNKLRKGVAYLCLPDRGVFTLHRHWSKRVIPISPYRGINMIHLYQQGKSYGSIYRIITGEQFVGDKERNYVGNFIRKYKQGVLDHAIGYACDYLQIDEELKLSLFWINFKEQEKRR